MLQRRCIVQELHMTATIVSYIMRALVFLIAIPFHEMAHAFVSWKLGDPTAKDHGRMTMDPRVHFHPIGFLCMLVAGIGFARPVPTDTRNFKNPKAGMAITAAAGPLANLLLAFCSMIVWKLFYYCAPVNTVNTYIALLFYYMVLYNVALAVFNLLPVPPWDGSRIALVFLPRSLYFKVMQYEQQIFIVMFLLLWLGVLDTPLYYLENAAFDLLLQATGFVERILFALNGVGV